MKFIHAVVYDRTEYENLREYGVDFESWGDITDGDYIVHCLYDCDKQIVLMLEDDTHNPVCAQISSFYAGIKHCGYEVEVTKAYVVVDNGLSYSEEAVGLCLVKGKYVEVED